MYVLGSKVCILIRQLRTALSASCPELIIKARPAHGSARMRSCLYARVSLLHITLRPSRAQVRPPRGSSPVSSQLIYVLYSPQCARRSAWLLRSTLNRGPVNITPVSRCVTAVPFKVGRKIPERSPPQPSPGVRLRRGLIVS